MPPWSRCSAPQSTSSEEAAQARPEVQPPWRWKSALHRSRRISQLFNGLTEAILSLARPSRPRTPGRAEVGENVFAVVPLAVPSPDGPRDREERFVAFFRR